MTNEQYDHTELTQEEAFKRLYDPAKNYFRSRICACESDIDELAADVLTDMLEEEKWNSFETHTEKGLRVWLWRAVQFKALDFFKRNKARPLITSIELAMQENPELEYENFATPPPDIAGDEEFKNTMELIKRVLAPKDYQLFELRLKGYSPPEVARLLNISEKAERTRYCRIRKRLQIELKKHKT